MMNASSYNQKRFKLRRWNKIKPKTSTIRGKYRFYHEKRLKKLKKKAVKEPIVAEVGK